MFPPVGFQKKFLSLLKTLLFVGFVMTVGMLASYLGMRFAVRGTEVAVSSLVGKTIDEAQKILLKVDLRLGISGERYDLEVPGRTIISQYPRPGGKIKVQREVRVIVSLGKRKSPVPNLIGSTLRVARLMVTQSGYELGTLSEISVGSVENRRVVQQSPAPDTISWGGQKIDILVSLESTDRYIMPDVIGQNLYRVRFFFEKKGFKLGKVQYANYDDVPRGSVVKQFPEPGYVLAKNYSVNLEVAR